MVLDDKSIAIGLIGGVLITCAFIYIIFPAVSNAIPNLAPPPTIGCPNYVYPSEENCQHWFRGDAIGTRMYAEYSYCEYDPESGWHYNRTHAVEDGKSEGMCLP